MEKERINIIKLSRTSGLSNSMFYKALNIYGSASRIAENINSVLKKSKVLCKDEEIEKEIEECEKIGAKIITYLDDEYPAYLKNIDSAPLTLTCRGNLKLLSNERKLAIIGSRNCSVNNFNFTKRIAKEISNYGYVIVSGLARGIDSAGHIGSLENGTIAVLGGSIDNIYPKENEYLYYQILDNNGLILSEFPLNTKPKPENFPMRNRIIAGLSRGILIISAGLISGTIHTANQAIKYGREVLVFPGSPYDDGCAGSNRLIQQGATMVVDTRDIIENLETFMPLNLNQNIQNNFLKDNTGNFLADTNYSTDDTYKNQSFDEEISTEKLTNEEIIISRLDYIPIEIGELLDSVDMQIAEANATIMKLNLEGKIIINSGKICLRKI